MKVRFFGRLRDEAGSAERDVDLPEGIATVEDIRRWLGRDIPQLLEPIVRVAVNDRLAADSDPLRDAHEVSFLPQVSGG